MRSVLRQIQRGVHSTGFIASVLVLIFSLQYVHMDAGLFWSDPAAYFSSGDFYYTFIISVYLGLLQFLLRLCAILPLGMSYAEDVDTKFLTVSLHRQSPRRYAITRMLSSIITSALAIITAFALTIIIYLILCPVEFQNDSFQVHAMQSPYGWRASPEYFYVFIIEAIGRIVLSASLWVCIGLAFSAIWPNRVFVIVSTLAFAYALEGWLMKLGGTEWTIAYLQAPSFSIVQSLPDPLLKQIILLLMGSAVCYYSMRFALSAKLVALLTRARGGISRLMERMLPPQHLWIPSGMKSTFWGRIWVDFRAFISPLSILCVLVITTMCVFLSSVATYAHFTIGELLLGTFGGLEWADPEPDIYGIGRWILLLLPAMMGIAYTLHRELSGRQMITVYRHGSSRQWWASKVVSSTLYAVVCVLLMFLWTMALGWLLGARGMQVYMTDSDGFRTVGDGVLSTMFVQFLLQVIMWTQLQMLVHLIFVDMRAGIIVFLLPLVGMLVSASSIEVTSNMWIPVNWGMAFRTELFCSSGYALEGGEWMALCSISPMNAFIMHATVIACLFFFHAICSRFVNFTNHSSAR